KMETVVTPDSPIALLQRLKEIGKRLPGEVRSLNWEIERDQSIAQALDQDASDPVEGAINPEHLESKEIMSPEELKRWVKGDGDHDMQAFSLPVSNKNIALEERFYGFGYASMDGKKGDPRYDPGFNRRFRYLRDNAGLGQSDIREYNFWVDRSDENFPIDATELRHDTTVGWVAQHLLSLFEKHAEKQGDARSLALFMAVQSEDLPIDGNVLQELGFNATEKTTGRDYDDPDRQGDNTLFVLTFDAFAKALIAMDKKSQVSP
ncbi:MAG: hypothetical protein AAB961_01140, partial [Patescibacteria group bacterium]